MQFKESKYAWVYTNIQFLMHCRVARGRCVDLKEEVRFNILVIYVMYLLKNKDNSHVE